MSYLLQVVGDMQHHEVGLGRVVRWLGDNLVDRDLMKELMVEEGRLHWYQEEDMLQSSQSRREAEAEGWLWGS